MFLMTDAQVANEQFLVLINDFLSSGEVADLFPDDEIENIIGGVRNEVGAFIRIWFSAVNILNALPITRNTPYGQKVLSESCLIF